ncbi:hypothetical protein J0910_11285 [Nocardiopsis sp. CNT-189]|uniref:diacylglycerol/lipid kinase family protein n=1 Tax=Nocardiopsis oceanisediminis TaxID=2816862 RepID=UPI003B30A461
MLVITNSAAGGSDDGLVKAAAAELGGAEVAHCSSPEELDDALELGHGTVVAAGGDGSLHALANALHRRGELAERTVGLIPMGTGNDFARTLGLPEDPVRAAALLREGAERRLDLIADDAGEITVNAVHLGAGADSTLAAEAWKTLLGPAGYPAGTIKAGLGTRGHRVRIAADGRTVLKDRKVLMVAVANGRYIGGGAELSPKSLPDDGMMDLIVSRALRFRRRIRYALRLASASHIAEPDVRHLRARTVSVRTDPANTSSDGEVRQGVTARTWRVLPGAWNFLVPLGGSGSRR